MGYKVRRKFYINENVRDFKEESTFQRLNRLNRKVEARGKLVTYGLLISNLVALLIGVGITYAESVIGYTLLVVAMALNVGVSVYVGKTVFKNDEDRRKALRKHIKELETVRIKEEDIVSYDRKERKVKFRYLETFFEVVGIQEKKTKGSTYLEFKDTGTEGEDYGRLCNVVLYESEKKLVHDKELQK